MSRDDVTKRYAGERCEGESDRSRKRGTLIHTLSHQDPDQSSTSLSRAGAQARQVLRRRSVTKLLRWQRRCRCDLSMQGPKIGDQNRISTNNSRRLATSALGAEEWEGWRTAGATRLPPRHSDLQFGQIVPKPLDDPCCRQSRCRLARSLNACSCRTND